MINDASIVTLVCNSINAKDTEVVKCRISELPRWFGLLIREFLDDQAELQHSNLGDLRLKFTNNELCGSGGLKFTIEELTLTLLNAAQRAKSHRVKSIWVCGRGYPPSPQQT